MSTHASYRGRFLEIDVARGLAVVAMICYHFYVVGKYPYYKQPYRSVAVAIASSFILISGISIRIAYNRGYRLKKFLIRSLKIAFYALLITVGSYAFLGNAFVRFGILHFISVGSLLIYPTFSLPYVIRGIIGVAILALHFMLGDKSIGSWYTIPLGIYPKGFYSIDYFPLVPWLGVMLIGTVISDILYPTGKRAFHLREPSGLLASLIAYIGRHSLVIYVAHIPIIYLIWQLIRAVL